MPNGLHICINETPHFDAELLIISHTHTCTHIHELTNSHDTHTRIHSLSHQEWQKSIIITSRDRKTTPHIDRKNNGCYCACYDNAITTTNTLSHIHKHAYKSVSLPQLIRNRTDRKMSVIMISLSAQMHQRHRFTGALRTSERARARERASELECAFRRANFAHFSA